MSIGATRADPGCSLPPIIATMGEPAGGPLLEVRNLTVRYGKAIRALDDVDLTVAEGTATAVLGANGAGKTTLLRAITGLLGFHDGAVAGGSVTLRGERIDGADPARIVRSGIAQVMEGRRVLGDLTIEENLLVGATTAPRRADLRARIAARYEMFPVLGDRRGDQAGLLSGGQQQMLAMARALMTEPPLLILDEPSLGLAPLIAEQIRDSIITLRDAGTTVLLVEQNAAMALAIADEAVVLRNGRVALAGPAAELADNASIHEMYLGTS